MFFDFSEIINLSSTVCIFNFLKMVANKFVSERESKQSETR